jgi:actin-related protein 6
MDQVVFEEFGFDGYTRVNCAEMCVRSYNDEIMNQIPSSISTQQRLFQNSSCQLVVDSGFSFTHIIPIFDGKVYHKAVKRCVELLILDIWLIDHLIDHAYL